MGNSALRSAQTLYAPSRVLKRAHRSTIVYDGGRPPYTLSAAAHNSARSSDGRGQQRIAWKRAELA